MVAIERDRRAEEALGSAIGGDELLRLRPHAIRTTEHVGGTLLAVAVDRHEMGADECRVALQGDGIAEEVAIRAVVRGEHRGLRPGAALVREDVRPTGTGRDAAGIGAGLRGGDDRRGAVDCDRGTEGVFLDTVRGEDLLLEPWRGTGGRYR